VGSNTERGQFGLKVLSQIVKRKMVISLLFHPTAKFIGRSWGHINEER
jgi:hypothetical protein